MGRSGERRGSGIWEEVGRELKGRSHGVGGGN